MATQSNRTRATWPSAARSRAPAPVRIAFARIAVAAVAFTAFIPARAALATPTLEAVVVWQHRPPGGDWDVHYALVGRPAPGSPGSEIAPRSAAPLATLAGDDENPAVAIRPRSTDPPLVVWQHRDPGGPSDIMWSHVPGAPARIALTGDDFDPAAALDTDGTGLAVWVNSGSVRSSVWNGASWSAPTSIPGSYDAASLPEITFLGDGRALVAFSALGQAVHRVHAAVWSGGAWAPASAVPLSGDQEALLPEHGWADYSVPQGAFTRIAVGAERSGAAVVLWGGPVTEDPFNRDAYPGVQGARMDAGGAWSALERPNGSTQVGLGLCHSPALAMTGPVDLVNVNAGQGLFEHTRTLRGAFTGEGLTLNTSYDEVRAALAPLEDRVLVAGTSLPFAFEDPPRSSVLTWSLGTLRPPTEEFEAAVTWSPPAAIPLPGEARYPAVASVLGGTQNPLEVTLTGRATGMAGLAGSVADTGPRSGDGDDRAGAATVEARSERSGDTSTSTVTVAEVTLATTPRIVIRGMRVRAQVGCSFGRSGSTTIASLQLGDEPPVSVDARTNMSAPLGALTIHVNQQELGPLRAVVRGLRVVGSGVDVTIGYAEASMIGCVGSGPPAGAPNHEH